MSEEVYAKVTYCSSCGRRGYVVLDTTLDTGDRIKMSWCSTSGCKTPIYHTNVVMSTTMHEIQRAGELGNHTPEDVLPILYELAYRMITETMDDVEATFTGAEEEVFEVEIFDDEAEEVDPNEAHQDDLEEMEGGNGKKLVDEIQEELDHITDKEEYLKDEPPECESCRRKRKHYRHTDGSLNYDKDTQ